MKIIITSTFSWEKKGGVPTFVNGTYTKEKKKGNNIKVFGIGSSKNDFISLSKTHTSVNYLKVWYYLLKKLRKIKNISKIEIHNGIIGFPLFFIYKTTYFFHGPAFEEAVTEKKSYFYLAAIFLIENLIFLRANSFHVISMAYKKKLQTYFFAKNKPIEIISPIVVEKMNNNIFRKNKKNQNFIKIICVRRLVKRTGVLEFINFLKKLSDDTRFRNKLDLIIVGNGPEKKNIEKSINFDSDKVKITLLGNISDKKRSKLFFESDYNIVPTVALEGFGLVVIEAGLQGCPSIVSNVGALPDVVSDNPISFVYKNQKELKSIFSNLNKPSKIDKINTSKFFKSKYGINDYYKLLS